MRLLWLDGTHLGAQKCNSEMAKFLLKGVVSGKAGIEDRKATNVLICNKDLKVSCKLKQRVLLY